MPVLSWPTSPVARLGLSLSPARRTYAEDILSWRPCTD